MDFTLLVGLILGLLAGGVVVLLVTSQMNKGGQTSAEEMKNAFSSLSLEALEKFNVLASETVKNQLEKSEATLEGKKKLIDSNLETVSKTLEELKKQSTVLVTQLGESQKETGKLRSTTEDLRNVLSSSQARGQWGERMVKDILDLMGLVENVNYVSQKSMESGERPDYTFNLPKD
ncbi:MAG TPA: DNA recombination protein RmuC, partial [Candidatus Marinimicrobia bacterium]|nr:DNA recombination protein RmuC [Candidatus Neomarinimicrobiota bacterium]